MIRSAILIGCALLLGACTTYEDAEATSPPSSSHGICVLALTGNDTDVDNAKPLLHKVGFESVTACDDPESGDMVARIKRQTHGADGFRVEIMIAEQIGSGDYEAFGYYYLPTTRHKGESSNQVAARVLSLSNNKTQEIIKRIKLDLQGD